MHSGLFYGIPVDENLQLHLDKVNPTLKSLFIQNDPNYLQEITIEGDCYIGRKLGSFSSLQSLELIEKNIFSLLNNLLPDYPFNNKEIYLIPIDS